LTLLTLVAVIDTCSAPADKTTAPIVATKLAVTTAPSASPQDRLLFPAQPVVQLEDAAGTAAATPGVVITASLTAGGGTLTGTTAATTSASGTAVFTDLAITGSVGAKTLTFTATGLTTATAAVTLVPGVATTIAVTTGNAQSAIAGAAVATAPAVTATDADGNLVSGVGVTFAVASGGGALTGATQTTNATGVATVGSWTLGTAAGANALTATATGLTGSPLTITATGTAGPVTKLGVATAPSASVPTSIAFPTQPVVQLQDANGNAVATAGTVVTASITAGGGTLGGTATATTIATGAATFTNLSIAGTVGGRTLTFAATGLTGATAPVTVTLGMATTMAINAGNNASAVAGATTSQAPSVNVTDAGGNVVSGVPVTFAVATGGGSVAGPSQNTSALGIATVGSWTLGKTAGTNTVTATSAGLAGSPVTFAATGTVGPAASFAKTAGDSLIAVVGTLTASAPSVAIADANGNGISGVAVTFSVSSGGGSLTGANQTTSASGVATAGSWTLGATAGINTLRAAANGIPGSPLTFTATAILPPVASVNLSPNPASVPLGLTQQVTAITNDASGNRLTGRTVTWSTDNAAVATVSNSGLITSITKGTANITATSETKTASVQVTVTGQLGITFAADQFALIPAGSFQMGTVIETDGSSRPVHVVTISKSFYLQRTEVTQGQWKQIMGSNPSGFSTCGDLCPVEQVSWNDVQTFIAQLNAANPGVTFRLPTEAEWEYAARAGRTGDFINLDSVAWTSSNSGSKTHPVATIRSDAWGNAWGLFDMIGNVSEWTQDWQDLNYYIWSPTIDPLGPLGPSTGSFKVFRGGSSLETSDEFFSLRSSIVPGNGPSIYVGFRLVRAATTAASPVATVTVTPSAPTLVIAQTQQLLATMKDATGTALGGRTVTWSSSDVSVATVSSVGSVTAIAPGTATITATSESKTGTAAVTVPAPPAVTTVIMTSPDGQSVGVGLMVATPPAVVVKTATGAVIGGIKVTFAIASGGGFIIGPTQTTGSDGIARVNSWTLGISAGTNTLTATVQGLAPVTFTATGTGSSFQVQQLVPGGLHACALAPSGAAYCWGDGETGSRGDGSTAVYGATPVVVLGSLTFTSVVAGFAHSCGLMAAGAAYCWGDNSSGQLGDGTTTNRLTPVAVAGGLTFQTLVAGGYGNTCGLTTSGAAYCWGSNGNGGLGDGTTTDRSTPVAVSGGLTFQSLYGGEGDNHICGLTIPGVAYCWGRNLEGQLGDGTTTSRTSPVPVSGSLTFVALTAGATHTCGLTASHAAFCWGDNQDGSLGDGTLTNRGSPVAVSGGQSFQGLSAGNFITCGVTTGSAAFCWGSNDYGQFGDGTHTPSTTPVAVAGGLAFKSVIVGYFFTCGVTTGNAAYCWGSNIYGDLGLGNYQLGLLASFEYLTPMAVRPP
jgi:formylglycine-generating enzyme required for sulfatase activity/alpha-tubulin suppressor-like RCC1 family protein